MEVPFTGDGLVVCQRIPGRVERGDCLLHLASDRMRGAHEEHFQTVHTRDLPRAAHIQEHDRLLLAGNHHVPMRQPDCE